MGSRLDAWVVVGIGGVVVACGVVVLWGRCPVGSLSCGSAGTIAEGWVVLTVLKNNDK